jgi:hypothetical protein
MTIITCGNPVSRLAAGLLVLALALPTSALAQCGDQIVTQGEQCDAGPGNGQPTSCCTVNCTFRTAGEECRASAHECDVAESCTGDAGECPGDGFVPGPKPCKPIVTLTSGPPIAMTQDFADALETNAVAATTYMSGTFNLVKGAASILKFDGEGAQQWLAVLLTNDSGAAMEVEVKWKAPRQKSSYVAAPGSQIIVNAPIAGGKKARFKLKAKAPATGTIEVATFAEMPWTLHATDAPRPLFLNQTTKPAKLLYQFHNAGPGVLWAYSCMSPTYAPANCTTVDVVAIGTTGQLLDIAIPEGGGFFIGSDPMGISTDADLFFSERSGISFATKG